MRRMWVLAALAALACNEPGPGNFEKFGKNDAGHKRLAAWVADAGHPVDQRAEALAVVAESGFPGKVRAMVDGVPDREAVAERGAALLAGRLPKADTDPEAIARLREGALALMAQVPEAKKGPIQQAIADWAFAGLTLETPADDVRQRIEPRIPPQEIPMLGAAGTGGAIVLVRHGFTADRLAAYVVSVPDPAAHLRLLEAFKRLHATPDLAIPFSHLEAIGKIKDIRAATYLLDLSQDANQESDVRAAAFNEAAGLMEDPSVLAGDRSAILARLQKMLGSADPDERWSATNFLVLLEGAAALDPVMAGLKDDGAYPNATEDPMKSMVDFCKATLWKKAKKDEAWAAVGRLLKSRNRVHRTLGIICAKASEDPTKGTLVAPLAGSRVDLQPVLGDKIAEGTLATNAREGLQMFGEVAADVEAGRLGEADAKLMRFAILVDLTDTGRAYRTAVAERFKADRAP